MPQVTTRVLTKNCAQYDRPTGLVASRIVPVQNAHMEMNMMTPGCVLLMMIPVTIAAVAPEIAAGEFLAAVSNMELPSRTSKNCLLQVSQAQRDSVKDP